MRFSAWAASAANPNGGTSVSSSMIDFKNRDIRSADGNQAIQSSNHNGAEWHLNKKPERYINGDTMA